MKQELKGKDGLAYHEVSCIYDQLESTRNALLLIHRVASGDDTDGVQAVFEDIVRYVTIDHARLLQREMKDIEKKTGYKEGSWVPSEIKPWLAEWGQK